MDVIKNVLNERIWCFPLKILKLTLFCFPVLSIRSFSYRILIRPLKVFASLFLALFILGAHNFCFLYQLSLLLVFTFYMACSRISDTVHVVLQDGTKCTTVLLQYDTTCCKSHDLYLLAVNNDLYLSLESHGCW